MEAQIDHVLAQRRELKYLIDENTVAAIKRYFAPFMRPDDYTIGCEGAGYPLASLYLDSADLLLCRQTLEAVKDRFKLRIRRYSDAPDEPVYFEIKRRVDQVMLKKRARVNSDSLRDLLRGRTPRADDTANLDSLNEFLNLAMRLRVQPTALVRYRREAYECVLGEPLRITFDRSLSYQLTSESAVWLGGAGWQDVKADGVVLEIKFTARYPAWVERMTRRFNLRQRSFPKYALSLHQAGLVDDRYRMDGGRF